MRGDGKSEEKLSGVLGDYVDDDTAAKGNVSFIERKSLYMTEF